jgi:hypothetical protein
MLDPAKGSGAGSFEILRGLQVKNMKLRSGLDRSSIGEKHAFLVFENAPYAFTAGLIGVIRKTHLSNSPWEV